MKPEKMEATSMHYGVKPFFYYLGRITVCLLRDEMATVVNYTTDAGEPIMTTENRSFGEIIARGVSICSPRDQFVKATGRDKAFGRAIKAVANEACSEWNRTTDKFAYKSDYKPVLTEEERRWYPIVMGCRNI